MVSNDDSRFLERVVCIKVSLDQSSNKIPVGKIYLNIFILELRYALEIKGWKP